MVHDTQSAQHAQRKEHNKHIVTSLSPQWLFSNMPVMDDQWWSSRIVSGGSNSNTLLVLTVTMGELRHWLFIAGMLLQSHCGDEEDGPTGLSS